MGCQLENLSAYFHGSDARVRPIGVQHQRNLSRDAVTNVEITREAARVLLDGYVSMEPVSLEFNGEPFFRGWVKKGDITYGNDVGAIHIRDPMQILEEGTFTKSYPEETATVETILNDILDSVADPFTVLNNVVKLSGHNQGKTFIHPEMQAEKALLTADYDSLFDRAVAGARLFGDEVLESFGLRESHVTFDTMTPRAAISKLARTFGVDVWVDMDGAVHFGRREHEPNQFVATSHLNDDDVPWKLLKYNIPDTSPPIGRVIVTGTDKSNPVETYWDLSLNNKIKDSIPKASASFDGYSGPTLRTTQKGISNMKVLEETARYILVDEYLNKRRGTLTMDTIADGEDPGMGEIKPGDLVALMPDGRCGIPGRNYHMWSINHTIKAPGTWTINVGVSEQLPSDISTSSWTYNPAPDTSATSVDGLTDTQVAWLKQQSEPRAIPGIADSVFVAEFAHGIVNGAEDIWNDLTGSDEEEEDSE